MLLRLVVAAAATMTVLSAQSWEVAPVAGYLNLSTKPIGSTNVSEPKDDDTRLHGHQPVYGLRLTRNTKGYYGFEATYLRSKARMDARLITLNGNTTDTVLESGRIWQNQFAFNGICYFMPDGERFRPFVTGGVQLQLYSTPQLPDWTFGSSKRTGFNYGGGFKVRLTKHWFVRLDVRDIFGGSPYDLQYDNANSTELRSPGKFRQFEATLGIGIRF